MKRQFRLSFSGFKNLKQYVLEFLMIFLAVTLGFFADSLREYYSDRKKESEYMQFMVKEMRTDSLQLDRVLSDTASATNLQRLSILILNGDYSQEKMREMYFLSLSATRFSGVIFNRNTLGQLKNTGAMRLIHNREVVDSLNKLDNLISAAEIQMSEMFKQSHNYVSELGSFFDHSYYFSEGEALNNFEEAMSRQPSIEFLTKDKARLMNFGFQIGLQAGAAYQYHMMLREIYTYQNNLIPFLEEKYNL